MPSGFLCLCQFINCDYKQTSKFGRCVLGYLWWCPKSNTVFGQSLFWCWMGIDRYRWSITWFWCVPKFLLHFWVLSLLCWNSQWVCTMQLHEISRHIVTVTVFLSGWQKGTSQRTGAEKTWPHKRELSESARHDSDTEAWEG